MQPPKGGDIDQAFLDEQGNLATISATIRYHDIPQSGGGTVLGAEITVSFISPAMATAPEPTLTDAMKDRLLRHIGLPATNVTFKTE